MPGHQRDAGIAAGVERRASGGHLPGDGCSGHAGIFARNAAHFKK
jgi:hypothetical protein